MRKYLRIAALVLAVLMMVSLFSGCKKKDNTITVGSKQFTENNLLGEIYAQLIEAQTDLKVERKLYLGGTAVCVPAMENGEIDMYVEYTGTAFGEILKLGVSTGYTSDEIYDAVKSGLADKKMTFFDPIGINNTYAVALLRENAETLGVKTMSDLTPYTPELRFGSAHTFFERESDGYNTMLELYGYDFASSQKMDSSLAYDAMGQGQLDVMIVFSTDSLLVKYDMTILEDDLQMFPAYHGAPVVRDEVLKEHPELNDVLNMLAGLISDQMMQQLDYQVDVENKSIESVAKQFLSDNGLN